MASALFSLTQDAALKGMFTKYEGVTHLAYVDDSHIHGPPQLAFAAFREYQQRLATIHLDLNLSKCVAHVPQADSTEAATVSQLAADSGMRYETEGVIV